MTTLSDLLSEAMSPSRTRPSVGGGHIVPTSLHESADPWMSDFMRQVQIVAPKYEAFLKETTGRGFKLFRTFLTDDDGRMRVRFDPSKKNMMEFGPMVVMNVAYSKAANAYHATVDVYADDINERLGSHEVSAVDIDLLADPRRMFEGVQEALTQISERRSDSVVARAKTRITDRKSKDRSPPATKVNLRNESPSLSDELERILSEARLGNTAQGGTFDNDRSNPSKVGPAAERDRVLRGARDGIERMLKALEVVREWVAKVGLAAGDKTGAAAAALRIALGAIAKTEDARATLSALVELPDLDIVALSRVVFETTDAIDGLVERRTPTASPDGLRAKDGLARLIDGLRQLQGMLRQAKLTGRVLDQVEAAIMGLKATRDAIDALSEASMGGSIATEPKSVSVPYGRFERRPVTEVERGMWIMGGSSESPSYHEVAAVDPRVDGNVNLSFTKSYIGADGAKKSGASFPAEFMIKAAHPYPR